MMSLMKGMLKGNARCLCMSARSDVRPCYAASLAFAPRPLAAQLPLETIVCIALYLFHDGAEDASHSKIAPVRLSAD
jgi:hypothetical protein